MHKYKTYLINSRAKIRLSFRRSWSSILNIKQTHTTWPLISFFRIASDRSNMQELQKNCSC